MSRLPSSPQHPPSSKSPQASSSSSTTTSSSVLNRSSVLTRITTTIRNLPHPWARGNLTHDRAILFRHPTLLPRFGRVLLTTVSLFSTLYLIRAHLLDWSANSGPSMLPTIPARHSYTLSSLWHRQGRGVRLGDVVQIKHPHFQGSLAGKRVVGLEGDFVVRDRDGSGVVGGIGDGKGEGEEEPRLIRVPEGHVWLAGDNLAWSRDSRFYGPVPMALIRGKMLCIVRGPLDWEWVGSGLRRARV